MLEVIAYPKESTSGRKVEQCKDGNRIINIESLMCATWSFTFRESLHSMTRNKLESLHSSHEDNSSAAKTRFASGVEKFENMKDATSVFSTPYEMRLVEAKVFSRASPGLP